MASRHPSGTPALHYAAAERLLDVAESPSTDDQVRQIAATTAVGHALLAAAPRRARKRPAAQQHGNGTLPRSLSWGDGE